jgi:hypothetical protein
MLHSHGLPRLEDSSGLLPRLGFLVQDHEHLRSLLARCEPENRSSMYDSLKPYLRFTPRSLDVYIAESKERAERQQLPTVDADGNVNFNSKLTPTIDQEVAAITPTLDQEATAIVQRVVGDAVAKWTLEVTCRKCTKFATFSGIRKADAVDAARDAGWAYDSWRDGSEICPDCLG